MTKQQANDLTNAIEAALARVTEIETTARKERTHLQRTLRLARGSSAPPTVARKTVPEQIEGTLREQGVVAHEDLARVLTLPEDKLLAIMSGLRDEGKVYNVSDAQHPRWCWVIGDKSTPEELNEQVRRLVEATPMSFRQLRAATGARQNRVSGALVRLRQRKATRSRLDNLGNGRTAIWFLRPTTKRG